MNYFIRKFRNFMKPQTKNLGRWNIDHTPKQVINKVDWSNEDHCGPCGQYSIDKTTKPISSGPLTPFHISNADPKGQRL